MRSGRREQPAGCREAVERSLAAIAARADLNAFLAVDATGAREDAARIDALCDAARAAMPLAGLTAAAKDNLCTLGTPTTCASRLLENYRSPFEATAVRRLREAGAAVIGKTNLDEFGMGSSTENSAFGPTLNPHDTGRVPGGSSGGSAAAVAAGLVDVALGSDTGGSVRQPAALCGVVGIKPTYGRVSRYGLVAFASSLDQVGTFGRSVPEAARVLAAIAGPDPLDSTALGEPLDLDRAAERDLERVVIGVPREYLPDSLDAGVLRCFRRAVERAHAAGAELRDVSLPHTALAVPAYCVLAAAEAASNLARFDGVRYGRRAPHARSAASVYRDTRTQGFGSEVQRRIVLGTYALSAGYHERYYARAQRARVAIGRDFAAVFDAGVDVLLTPTSPTAAFRLGERRRSPLAMYRSDAFTVAANLAGLPALSLPVGLSDGLPVGGQLMAGPGRDEQLIGVATAIERVLGEA